MTSYHGLDRKRDKENLRMSSSILTSYVYIVLKGCLSEGTIRKGNHSRIYGGEDRSIRGPVDGRSWL
jgi:hypothetical protein